MDNKCFIAFSGFGKRAERCPPLAPWQALIAILANRITPPFTQEDDEHW
jgi:hypothetical protein